MRQKTTLRLLLILLLGYCSLTGAQTIVCENSNCTANDYTLENFYLGDENGVPFGPGYCEPGETVNAYIWTNFVANSAASRYTLYLHFNLYVDDVFVGTVDECYYEGLPIPTNVTLSVYNFSWDCGSEITLANFYMSWQPNANAQCGCNGAKCYKEESILVQGPLIANFEFEPSCESAYTLNFISTTSGGNPPYTYLWDFGDGTTSTLQNPTHTYTSTGPYTVTLTVMDQDNIDSFEFEIVSFEPNLPPEIFPPPNLNIEGCSVADIPDLPLSKTLTDITEAQFNAAGGTLILSNAIVSFTYIDTVTGSCPIQITRTFTVVDTCDNSDTGTQIIEINDTTAPTASNIAPLTLQCVADLPAPDINVVSDASDNCSTPVVTFVSEVSDNNSCPEVIIRTYNVEDDCGNATEVTQTIIVNDTTLPTASTPAPTTIECIGDIPPVDVNIITDESDNCSIPVVAFVSESQIGTSCPLSIVRTYSITDDCGNTIFVDHEIIINDTTPPTANGPADLTVQCASDVPPADINDVTNVSDNCSVPLVTFLSEVSDGGLCPEIITRTYSVTDECGNQILLTQTITISDDITPSASTPAPINVQCISDVPSPDPTVITDEADNCSNPTVSFISDVATGQCPQIITRTYRVEDDCGNFIDILQSINVNDDVLPTASNPADITFDCSDNIPTPDVSVVTDAADNCSTPTVSFVSDVSDGNCPETIIRTYSVTDECGNQILVTQNLISNDTEAPLLVGSLNDDTVSCTAIPDPPNLEFIDNCSSSLDVVFTETDTNNNNTADYVITRVWVVTDSCGNSSTFTQIINVLILDCIVSACNSCGPSDDTIPPTASNPADINVNCTEDIPPPDINVVTDAADNCVPPIVAFVSETISVDCFEKVTRVYSVTDECGNQILVQHNINVIDNFPPTASNPVDIDVFCSEDIPAPDISVVTDASDNCSDPVVAFVSDVSNNACNERITRTYSVTDSCGNSILVTQFINVLDVEAPTASNPADINIACIEDIPIPDTSVINDASDNCSTPVVSFVSDISDNNSCPETITRTYRVTDECGNFTDVIQLIRIEDNIPPTASAPADIQVSCIDMVPAPNISIITDEADNCGTPTVAFISDVSNNLSCPEVITRSYSVTDNCGNSIVLTQEISVFDDVPPTASNPEIMEFLSYNDVPAPDPLVVIDEADNCSIPTVAFLDQVSDGLSCPETLTRNYSVTDACGNSITVFQKIIITDNEPPTASNPPTLTFSCENDIPDPDINVVTDAFDNQSIPTITFVSESTNNQSCPEVITRIYNVSDDCGNSINVTHNLIIDDDVPPTASNPEDLTVYSIDNVPAPDPAVVIDEVDNCSVPQVAYVSEISNNDSCPQIITRTYSVTDDCGNSINVLHNIIIEDVEDPVASGPGNQSFNCEPLTNIPPQDTTLITASDNIGISEIIFVSDTSDEQSCPETVTRVYRVIDLCGNATDVTQEFYFYNDTELPTATAPAPLALDCIDDIPDVDVEIITDEADNCTTPTVSFVSEDFIIDGCLTTITRVYAITDDCGNSIEVDHVITVVDDSPPTLDTQFETEITITCGIVPEIPTLEFSDNCIASLTEEYDEQITDMGNGNYDIFRTWTVYDECFNETIATQTIHMVSDNQLVQSEVSLCINDDAIDLSDLIEIDGDGYWESDNIDILNDLVLDPTVTDIGTYLFTYQVNENDCSRTQEVLIDINDLCIDYPCIKDTKDVTITKLVTPNNDGFHDNFEVTYILNNEVHNPCEVTVDVIVYNRWGTKVYENSDYQNDWNGFSPSSSVGGATTLPAGSYYYIVTLRNSGLKPIQGYIYLGVEN